jgi:hypothetical protein
MMYDELKFDIGFRLDLIVNNSVIIEIKSVEALHNVHFKQLLTYLRLTDKKLGILVNFNASTLTDKISLVRIVNNLWFFCSLYGNNTWCLTEAIALSDGFGKSVQTNKESNL